MIPRSAPLTIAFPSAMERDDMEFLRSGASNYTRAIDDAAALWEAGLADGACTGLEAQVAVFAGRLSHLARHRPEVLGDMVRCRAGAMIELGMMPDILKAMLRE